MAASTWGAEKHLSTRMTPPRHETCGRPQTAYQKFKIPKALTMHRFTYLFLIHWVNADLQRNEAIWGLHPLLCDLSSCMFPAKSPMCTIKGCNSRPARGCYTMYACDHMPLSVYVSNLPAYPPILPSKDLNNSESGNTSGPTDFRREIMVLNDLRRRRRRLRG